MLPKVYIDGHVGTTGLRIRDWMANRTDVELVTLPDDLRKDADARRSTILESDIAVLCLPDDAAREVASWTEDSNTRLIDASTAHRIADDWVYGLPELHSGQRESIIQAKNVSNPGCYPSAFVLLTRPLIDAGLVSEDAPFSIHALSGYSGGGRSMIEKWESPDIGLESLPHEAPYSLDKMHKHIPEMVKYASLTAEPQFVPAVGPFRCGMRVEVPIHASLLSQRADGAKVWETFHKLYENETFVKVAPMGELGAIDEWSFDPQSCNDTNLIELHVVPHPSGHLLLVALLDNLGKGASGAAIQNLNLMLGISENTGLPEASD